MQITDNHNGWEIYDDASGVDNLQGLLEMWCRGAELNRRHTDFQSVALPTELPRHSDCSDA
jgi:hypothetical protein